MNFKKKPKAIWAFSFMKMIHAQILHLMT